MAAALLAEWPARQALAQGRAVADRLAADQAAEPVAVVDQAEVDQAVAAADRAAEVRETAAGTEVETAEATAAGAAEATGAGTAGATEAEAGMAGATEAGGVEVDFWANTILAAQDSILTGSVRPVTQLGIYISALRARDFRTSPKCRVSPRFGISNDVGAAKWESAVADPPGRRLPLTPWQTDAFHSTPEEPASVTSRPGAEIASSND